MSRRRGRRRGPGARHRPARRRAADRRVRRRARRVQPGGRPDGDHLEAAVRVVIAEDLFLLRDGLIRLLEAYGFEVGAAVDNGDDLLAALRASTGRTSPWSTSGCRRRSPTRGCARRCEARAELPGLPVLVLSQYVEQLYARELLADGAGAVGYLLKDRVLDGAPVHRRGQAGRRRRHRDGPGGHRPAAGPQRRAESPLGRLSPREREVLELMAEGRSNAAIAQRLFVTERAVAKHTAAHLHQARPAAVRRRQPPRPRRPRLPGPLTRPPARRPAPRRHPPRARGPPSGT